jgi:CRP/FNR family transcriptional regulator, anaerobic regulatory protein
MEEIVDLRPGSNCLRCPVRTKGLCAPLPPNQNRLLERVSTSTHLYPAGSELFGQGELCSSYVTIMEGWAFTCVLLEQGNRQILDFALPGELLGFRLDPERPMAYSAQCLTAVRACLSPKREVCQMLRREARFALKLCELEACQEARSRDHLANIGQRDAIARVAHLIVGLFRRLHDRLPERAGEAIEFPLQLAHIGDALGITREHASRTLRALREQGVCDARGGALRILDPASLLELSGFEQAPPHLPAMPRHA